MACQMKIWSTKKLSLACKTRSQYLLPFLVPSKISKSIRQLNLFDQTLLCLSYSGQVMYDLGLQKKKKKGKTKGKKNYSIA